MIKRLTALLGVYALLSLSANAQTDTSKKTKKADRKEARKHSKEMKVKSGTVTTPFTTDTINSKKQFLDSMTR